VADQELSPAVPSDQELRSILGEARTIAVVGLSSDARRPSHRVARYLKQKGYRIVPVNPNETEVLGERAYASLNDIPADIHIDVVDVFRRTEETPQVARAAAEIGARALWLQSGIVNEEAFRIGNEAGLDVVMGVCIHDASARLEEGA
jgi:predicted CoA-binding protein